jgi:translation initiation factor IF-3
LWGGKLKKLDRRDALSISNVRLVTDDDNQVVPTEAALRMAFERGLDLVMVSDKSTPPVCRIQDFNKLLYEKKKSQKRHTHQTEVKEIQLKLNIADHDFETKVNKAKEFLSRGDKVKVTIRLKGREREMPDRVHALLDRMIKSTESRASNSGFGVAILEKA